MARSSKRSDRVGQSGGSRFPALWARKKSLVGLLSRTLLANSFANRYVLHPTELPDVAGAVADSFLDFLDSTASEAVFALGESLERRGLVDSSMLPLVPKLRQYCRRALASGDPKLLAEAEKRVDLYAASLLSGFGAAREEEILSDQEQLRRALSTAIESQSRELLVKNHAIATSINGIMLADLSGRVSYVNQSFLAMFGYRTPAEVIGKPFSEFWIDEEGKRIVERISSRGGWFAEHVAKRTDGTTLTVSLAGSLISDQTGEAIGVMASLVDITERRRLETQMQQVQKMDDLGQLAGGIVHDFNNLLTAIGGNLHLLLLEAPPESSLFLGLMQIKSAVDRGAGLTRQLRYFTRQAAGARQLVSLNEVARETYELLRRTFPKEIVIRLELAAFPWMIEADPDQMSQVMMNLCLNARDAIEERAGSDSRRPAAGIISIETANVTLSEEEARSQTNARPGRFVLLRVSDSGIGMPPELVQRLFIPFVSTKTQRSGSGLGLSVVYGIVRGHGGSINVASKQGEGSTFSIYLPMAEPALAGRTAPKSDFVLSQGEGTILIVDDEEQVRDVIGRALKLCGYRVLVADGGKTALTLFAVHRREIDLVILDFIMPGMDGRETLARMKELDPSVAAVFVTGYTADRIGDSPELLGAKGLIEKPLDLKRFTEQIRELMRVQG